MAFDELRSIKKVVCEKFPSYGLRGSFFQVKTKENSREIFILRFHGHEQHVMAFDELRSIGNVDRQNFHCLRSSFFR